MSRDTDGWHYFDYVSWNSVVANAGGDNDGYSAYLQKLGDLTHAGLLHSSRGVLEK